MAAQVCRRLEHDNLPMVRPTMQPLFRDVTDQVCSEAASDFQIESGGNYLCPRCSVEKGGLSPLRHIPSDTRDEFLRCPVCEYELLIPHV